eukprot:scaffold32247_cov146-Isochrysis_galbana.AAC.1
MVWVGGVRCRLKLSSSRCLAAAAGARGVCPFSLPLAPLLSLSLVCQSVSAFTQMSDACLSRVYASPAVWT